MKFARNLPMALIAASFFACSEQPESESESHVGPVKLHYYSMGPT